MKASPRERLRGSVGRKASLRRQVLMSAMLATAVACGVSEAPPAAPDGPPPDGTSGADGSRPQDRGQPVAELRAVVTEAGLEPEAPRSLRIRRGGESIAAEIGMTLLEQDFVDSAGFVLVIVFRDGGEVLTGADSEIELAGPDSVRAHAGSAFVKIKGLFRVETEYGTGAAAGTQFEVEVGEESASVGVFEGSVEVETAGPGSARLVGRSEEAVLRRGGEVRRRLMDPERVREVVDRVQAVEEAIGGSSTGLLVPEPEELQFIPPGLGDGLPGSPGEETQQEGVLTRAELGRCLEFDLERLRHEPRIEAEEARWSGLASEIEELARRIDAARPQVDRTSQQSVDEYNAMVEEHRRLVHDYKEKMASVVEPYQQAIQNLNTQCVGNRYYRADMEAVKRQLGIR